MRAEYVVEHVQDEQGLSLWAWLWHLDARALALGAAACVALLGAMVTGATWAHATAFPAGARGASTITTAHLRSTLAEVDPASTGARSMTVGMADVTQAEAATAAAQVTAQAAQPASQPHTNANGRSTIPAKSRPAPAKTSHTTTPVRTAKPATTTAPAKRGGTTTTHP